MSSAVSSAPLIITLQNFASPELDKIAEDATRVKAEVEASPITIAFAPVEVPTIPPIEAPPIETHFAPIEPPVIPPIPNPTVTINFAPIEVPPLPELNTAPMQESLNKVGISAAEMSNDVAAASGESATSFNQVGLSATAMSSQVSEASSGSVASLNEVGAAASELVPQVKADAESFDEMTTHIQTTEVSLRSIAAGVRSFGMMGTELTTLGMDFGVLDSQTGKYLRTITTMITLVATAARMYSFLSMMTTGQTAAVAIEGTTEGATTGAISLSAVAHNIYAAACGVATAAENALNISHATFLALCGVGIGVIIAAAAAVSIFAGQMNNATNSVKNYNTAASQTPAATSNIQRAQSQVLLRRGIEP